MAHERWTLSIQLQRLHLADVSGRSERAAGSVDTLRALAQGPLWQEVQDALRITPATKTMSARVEQVLPTGLTGSAPPLSRARMVDLVHIPWSWPGVREIVPALVIVALVLGGAVALKALPSRPVDHVRDAYLIDYAAIPSASTPSLRLAPRQAGDGLPRQVDLYQENRVFRTGIALADGNPTTVQLTAADTGHYYQIFARPCLGTISP